MYKSLQNSGRPAPPSLLASVSIRHQRSRANLSPKEQRDLSSASEPHLRYSPRKGYLSPFLPRCRAEGRKKYSATVNNSKNNSFQRGTSCWCSDTWKLHNHVCLFSFTPPLLNLLFPFGARVQENA
ncbi:hypothetical protein CDAR_209201 [Caerostris darwini]|uniref:Uncharacterized protein n=1 Tax=Caerostris darwini TaxID=1538125 RepID=A0AAV4VG90_9ARAC|nr:hypothetical protein CDAR_209201 [Caerostris darwini]